MAILVDGLLDVGEDHRSLHARGHLSPRVEDTPVVHDHHRMFRPVKVALESRLLQQRRPAFVGRHISVIDIEWQGGHTAFCFRLHHLLKPSVLVECQDRVRVNQLEAEGLQTFGIPAVDPALGVDVVPGAVGNVDLAQQIIVLRMVLAEVLRHHQAIDDFGCYRTSRLEHKLQIARRAVVRRMIRVHRQRVLLVIVGAGLLSSGLRMDDAEAGRSHRMLIEPADDAANKVLQRLAAVFVVEAVWLSHILDDSHTWIHHPLQKLDLHVLVLLHPLSIESGYLQASVPGLPVLVHVVQKGSGSCKALPAALGLRLLVQGLSDIGSEGM
mmetsp:Transcript_115000/g.161619  ORF Transcript_115000/g.161619 Transcript_115000/m.161619 type:complete len:326 (+) Transcript_115000:160-1137(+)